MALADRSKIVWLVTSDGACAEGSVWEAFRFASEQQLTNLRVYLVANGLSAYQSVDVNRLWDKLSLFLHGVPHFIHRPKMPFKFLEGLNGHYLTISDEQYAEAMAA
jgi:hypothetical protein